MARSFDQLSGFFSNNLVCFLCSLTQFFDRAREIEFFKTIIQIPDLPDVSDGSFTHLHHSVAVVVIVVVVVGLIPVLFQAPPNFLRAAALGEYKRPVVVMPNEERQEEEAEPQPESRETPQVMT